MFQAVIPVLIYSVWRGENYENSRALQSVMQARLEQWCSQPGLSSSIVLNSWLLD
jgi:hypothetical protein